MGKYIKVMFGNRGADYEYKLNEVNVADIWNPELKSGKEFGGFNFSVEEKILRWLARGDTIYDIIIPEDAEVIDVVESATPHGVFRSNKIIPTNPRKVTDEMAMDFYKKSTIPEIAYYAAMASCAVMGYDNTAKEILKDKVNQSNIDVVLDEWNSFIHKPGKNRADCNDTVKYIEKVLNDMSNK